MKKEIFSKNERLNYLLNIYFGDYESNPILCAVQRAYRDFSRTQTGFSKNPNKEEIQKKRVDYLVECIDEICTERFSNQKKFDEYHENIILELKRISQKDFTVGQVQKWINMSLKYCLIIDSEKYDINADYFHIPIDNIILEKLKGCPSIGTWSKLDNYQEYLEFQEWVRTAYPDILPIKKELDLWERK